MTSGSETFGSSSSAMSNLHFHGLRKISLEILVAQRMFSFGLLLLVLWKQHFLSVNLESFMTESTKQISAYCSLLSGCVQKHTSKENAFAMARWVEAAVVTECILVLRNVSNSGEDQFWDTSYLSWGTWIPTIISRVVFMPSCFELWNVESKWCLSMLWESRLGVLGAGLSSWLSPADISRSSCASAGCWREGSQCLGSAWGQPGKSCQSRMLSVPGFCSGMRREDKMPWPHYLPARSWQ